MNQLTRLGRSEVFNDETLKSEENIPGKGTRKLANIFSRAQFPAANH